MHSRKSVGPIMEPWGTPALTGYSCEDFPSRTTRSCLLLRKEEIRPNIWPEIPWNLSLWRRPACQTLSKALDISRATARVGQTNSIRCNGQKICSWSRRPKTILEIRKRPHFSRWSTILLFTSFSKTLLTIERRLTGEYFLAVDLSPTFLNTGTPNETFNIWKTRLLQTLIEELS